MAFIHITGRAEPGDRIIVAYDSVRGDGIMTKSGTVEHSDTEPHATIVFERDDGQRMSITHEGELRSIGSTHPFTGTVVDVKLDWVDDIEMPA